MVVLIRRAILKEEEGSQASKKRCVSFSKSQERRWRVNTPVWKGDGEFFCQPLITFLGSHEIGKHLLA